MSEKKWWLSEEQLHELYCSHDYDRHGRVCVDPTEFEYLITMAKSAPALLEALEKTKQRIWGGTVPYDDPLYEPICDVIAQARGEQP